MPPKPTIQLTQDQIDFFFAQGYLAIDAITTQDEVESLRKIYQWLFTNKIGRENGDFFDLGGTDEDGVEESLPQMLKPSKYAPQLKETLHWANANAIARQLFGDEIQHSGEHMIYKQPYSNSPTPWHQDQAYHKPDVITRNVTIWMPLHEATIEGGCMQFVPGSHKIDVQPHHSLNNDDRITALEVDNPKKWQKESVACPLPAGGATLHHSYMLHYTAANRSATPRRAYILGFTMPKIKRDTPLQFPWMEKKPTKREKRVAAAKEKETS